MANPKGNPENLSAKGRLKNATSSERQEIGRKGGLTYGRNLRKKKSIAEALEIMQEINKKKLVDKAIKKKKPELAEVINEIGWLPYQLQGIINNPIVETQHRLKAIQEVLDRTDGKPVQTIKQTNRNIDGATIDDEGNQEA
jgi:hypothetical protein